MTDAVVRPPALVLAGAAGCAAAAGLATHVNPKLALGAAAAVLAVAIARRWPIAVWMTVLAAVLVFSNETNEFIVLPAGAFTIYAYDTLPVLAIVAGWTRGPTRFGAGTARAALVCGTIFFAAVAFAWLRTVETAGLTPALQARKLFPLVIAIAIPLVGTRFGRVESRQIATAFALGAIALAARTLFLLASGAEAVHGGTRNVAEVSSVLGVERVFQTWEPFLGGALGLTLLAYTLMAKNVTPLHTLGLAASTVPLLFGFFRVAWAFAALVGLLVFAFAPSRRRARLVAGFVLLCVTFMAASTQMETTGPSYVAQVLARSNEVTPSLDTYRAQEYGAVWREIKKDPILGQGFGTEYVGSWTTHRAWAHNAYQWLWWRIGIVGLVAFVGFLLAAIAAGLQSARYLDDPDDRGLAAGFAAALLFTSLAAIFHENFETAQTNLLIGLVIAQLIFFARRVDLSRGE